MNLFLGQIDGISYINFLGALGILLGLVGLLIFKSFVKNNRNNLSSQEKIAYIFMSTGWGGLSCIYNSMVCRYQIITKNRHN